MNKNFLVLIGLFLGSPQFGMEQDDPSTKKRKTLESSYDSDDVEYVTNDINAMKFSDKTYRLEDGNILYTLAELRIIAIFSDRKTLPLAEKFVTQSLAFSPFFTENKVADMDKEKLIRLGIEADILVKRPRKHKEIWIKNTVEKHKNLFNKYPDAKEALKKMIRYELERVSRTKWRYIPAEEDK